MSKLNEGNFIGETSITSTLNGNVTLPCKNYRYTILYFYPKDDTPGCTTESKDFSNYVDEFKKIDTIIYGISKDSLESHKKFITKHDIKVDLLCDDIELAEKLGVWQEKSMFGKKYMGIDRTTFLIDNSGKIIKVWNKVKVKNHVNEVMEYINSLNS